MNIKTKKLLRFLSAALTACIGIVPGAAAADPGDGIKGENFNLGLSATAGTAVNSNLFYQDTPTAPTAFALVVTPGLSLDSVNRDNVALSLDWALAWTQFVSQERFLRDQSGLSTDLGSAAHFNQGGNVSFRLEEDLQRTNDPPNGPGADPINRFNNRLGGIVGIHPGGRALQGFLGYHWSSINFRNDALNFSQANRDEHALQGRFAWQFRPRTAALLTANYTFVNYDQPTRTAATGATIPNNDSRPLRLTATLNGLLLPRVSAEATAGYGRANYEAGPTFNSFIGRGILSYHLSAEQNEAVSVAVERSFADSVIGNFVISNRVDLKYGQRLANEKLRVELGVFYDRRNYRIPDVGPIPVVGGTAELPDSIVDNRIGGGLGGSLNLRKWLALNAGYQLNSNLTQDNVRLIDVTTADATIAGRDYIQHIATASLTARY